MKKRKMSVDAGHELANALYNFAQVTSFYSEKFDILFFLLKVGKTNMFMLLLLLSEMLPLPLQLTKNKLRAS